MAAPMQDPYPTVKLASPSRTLPTYEQRASSPSPSSTEDDIPLRESPSHSHPSKGSKGGFTRLSSGTKRESYDLSGSTYLITNTGKTIKLPVPSDSKDDPLNWSLCKTAGAMFCVLFYSVVCLLASQAIDILLPSIQADFEHEHAAPWLLKALVTAPPLFMGLGCLLWVLLSIGMGRRPTLLIATLVELIANIWASAATSYGSLLGAVCCLGLCEGLSLSLAFLMVIDLTYIKQRPRAVALMWCVAGFLGTSSVALVPAMSQHGRDWRRVYQVLTIPVFVSLIVSLALYPETYFKRPTVTFDGMKVQQSATEKLTIIPDQESDSKKDSELPEYRRRTGFAGWRDRMGLARSPFASWKSMGRCFLQMGYCVVNPLIFWVFIASSFNYASMIYIGTTYPQVLLAAPYHMSPDLIGTVNIASGTGALVGFLVWNLLICGVLNRLSKRNHGALEAEHYLVGYIIPVTGGALSSLIYGLAVEHKWHAATIYFSYGLNGFSFVILMITNTLWVAGAFPRWAAPALAVVGSGSYLLSFAVSFALAPWVVAHGYKWVGIELAILQIAGGLIAMPVAFWGKSARQALHGRWADDRSGALRPL